MELKNKLKNGFFSFAGTIFPKAMNLISIPIFVRLMTTEEYGRTSVFATYVTIFSIVLGMDFAVAVGKGTLEYKNKKNEFLSVGVFLTFILTCIILVVVNIWNDFLCGLLNYSRMQLNILILYAYATFLISYKSMELIYSFEYTKNFILNALVSILSLGASIVCMVTWCSNDRFFGRIVGAAVPAIIISTIVWGEIMIKGKRLYNRSYVKFFCLMGIPLIPHSLSQFILGNADKIMIENMISSSKSGIYSFVTTMGLVMTAITEAVNNLWNPWMFRKLDDDKDQHVRRMFVPYIFGFSAISVLIEGVSPEIIKIIGTKDYYEGMDYCVWMTFTAYLLFLCNKYVDIQYYEKKTYFVSIGTVMAALINIALNVLWLEKVGYKFAVISTLVSYTVLLFLYMFIVDIVIKRKLINSFFVIGIMLTMYIETFVIQLLKGKILVRYIITITFVISFIVLAYANWRKTSEENGFYEKKDFSQ